MVGAGTDLGVVQRSCDARARSSGGYTDADVAFTVENVTGFNISESMYAFFHHAVTMRTQSTLLHTNMVCLAVPEDPVVSTP